jgi:hypothetical protein
MCRLALPFGIQVCLLCKSICNSNATIKKQIVELIIIIISNINKQIIAFVESNL